MEKKQKIWIKGNNKRGEEVINKLKNLGGENLGKFKGNSEDLIYYIYPDGHIAWVKEGTTTSNLIKDNYKEYKLPNLQIHEFKTFDKVLAKKLNSTTDVWDLYEFAFEDTDYIHFVGGTTYISKYFQIIPYNEDTKHLLGTHQEYND